jgi:protein-S-isoprenylcysteine O-methyltransferase Ste14
LFSLDAVDAKLKSIRDSVIAIITVLVGAAFVLRGSMALVHQAAIYIRGSTSVHPWQALLFGVIWLALGLLLIAKVFYPASFRRRD